MLFMLVWAWLFWPARVEAVTPTIALSQVKTRGAAAGDEFVELFNPLDVATDLNGYKLVKQTSSGSSYTLLTFGQVRVSPRSYYLLALRDSTFAATADLTYSTALADNNRLMLIDATGATIDALSWGDGAVLANHGDGESYQRVWDSVLSWTAWSVMPFAQAGNSSNVWVEPVIDVAGDEAIIDAPVSTVPQLALTEIQLWPASGDSVWIEVRNNGTTDTNIDVLTIEIDGTPLFSLSGSLPASQYGVWYIDSTLEVRSRSVRLRLASGETIDEVIITPPTAVGFESFSRLASDNWDWTATSTGGRPNINAEPVSAPICAAPVPTNSPESVPPTSSAPPVTNLATSGRLRLNEIFANPSGDEAAGEFIELRNLESFAISLDGWQIRDAVKTTTLADTTISANGYLVVRRTQSGLSLNNTNETVTLLNAAGLAVDTFSYATASEDQSWNRNDNGWYEAAITPGADNLPYAVTEESATAPAEPAPTHETSAAVPNTTTTTPDDALSASTPAHTHAAEPVAAPILTAPAATPPTTSLAPAVTTAVAVQPTSFAKWDAMKPNKQVTIVGVVTVMPGTFNEKTAYLQDIAGGSAGVELYFTAADWPDLAVGDIAQITGKKSAAKNGRRLLLASARDIVVLDHIDFTPALVSADELTAAQTDTMVMIETTVSGAKSGVQQASDIAPLSINLAKSGLNIAHEQWPARALIAGLYKHGVKPSLWPRDEDDLIFETIAPEAEPTAPTATTATETPIKQTVLESAATTTGPDWLTPFAAAGSAGGLGWYFFQDSLRKHGAKLLEIIKK